MEQTKTFNDFTAPGVNREAFILEAIREYQKSDTYLTALDAQDYYSTNNTAIGNRLGYLERQMRSKVNVKFHRLRNAFFPKAIKRLVLYLMGNGATLDDGVKEKIDRKFDNTLILAAINACVDGVVWGFPDFGKLTFFRSTEFVPLVDERTGIAMAGIRFWQLNENKPMYIEFFEIDGITEYEANNNGANIKETSAKRPYKREVQADAFTTTVINGENYGVLPIFPLYANELGTSELTTGLKALIDAHDYASSDWADNITLIEGLYGIVKNYGGQDAASLLAEIQQLKVIIADGDESSVTLNPVEMPFESRLAFLEHLEQRMYDDFLLPNKRQVGGVTAREIDDAREDMDIKANLLEWQVAEFVEQVLLLKGHNEMLADFKRRTVNNDSEDVGNIATQTGGEAWIDIEEAIRKDPTIPEDRKDALIQRMLLAQTGVPNDYDEEEPPEDDSEV